MLISLSENSLRSSVSKIKNLVTGTTGNMSVNTLVFGT